MLDREAGTIWRDLEVDQSSFRRLLLGARMVIGHRPSVARAQRLKTNFETRPYEWAWCLYAGAIAAGARRDGHVV